MNKPEWLHDFFWRSGKGILRVVKGRSLASDALAVGVEMGIVDPPRYTLDVAATESTPVTSVSAGISSLIDTGGANPAAIAGLFIHPFYAGHTVSKRFTTAGDLGTGDTYEAAMLVHLESAHATPDAVALAIDAVAEVAGASAYGSNIIVRSELAGTNPKLIGLEIDVLPAAGTGDCAAGSSGLYLLLFGNERLGPAIVVVGSAGGAWDHGLVLNNIRATDGAGVVVQSGAPEMGWGIHLNNGTYTTAAAQLGAQNDKPALILNRGVAGATTNIVEVRDQADTAKFVAVDGTGVLTVRTAGNSFQGERYSADGNGPNLNLKKSRHATSGSHTIVQSGDDLGAVVFYGSNGTSYDLGGYIVGEVDGTPGTSADMPGRITVFTSPDGSATPVGRVLIGNDGGIAIQDGITAPATRAGWATLYVDTADGDLKVKFGDGTVKTIAVDT